MVDEREHSRKRRRLTWDVAPPDQIEVGFGFGSFMIDLGFGFSFVVEENCSRAKNELGFCVLGPIN